jgi:hypothetical protein
MSLRALRELLAAASSIQEAARVPAAQGVHIRAAPVAPGREAVVARIRAEVPTHIREAAVAGVRTLPLAAARVQAAVAAAAAVHVRAVAAAGARVEAVVPEVRKAPQALLHLQAASPKGDPSSRTTH